MTDQPNRDLPDVTRVVEKLLNDIQTLQQMEQELFHSLETNPNLTAQQQQQIIEKTSQLSNMRVNLYTSLSEINGYSANALDSSTETLKEQRNAINIVENELNRSKKKLEILEVARDNKVRLVEINKYYGDRYAEHASLMKVIIFTLIPIIILTILNNKGFLPIKIYFILIIIISAIGAVFFFKIFTSIMHRDNMNYDTYDWPFDKESAPSSTSSDSDDPWESIGMGGTCVGQDCCSEGQTYNEEENLCISEGFQNQQLSPAYVNDKVYDGLIKTQPGKYKADVTLGALNAYNS
jgi:hypothetical protein